MSERATNWSVTINNPTASDEEAIALARQKGWTVDGQLEKGENGTPHYQLHVKTPQTRFSALKSAFPRAHIEVARNVKALASYVRKEDTRVGSLATQSEQYPSLQKLWDMFADYTTNKKHINLLSKQPDERLVIFDDFIRHCINEDYVVETMAVNPQVRSAVKNFGQEIIFRSLRRQKTDRQTDEKILEHIKQNEDEVEGTQEEQSEGEESDAETDGWSDSSSEST